MLTTRGLFLACGIVLLALSLAGAAETLPGGAKPLTTSDDLPSENLKAVDRYLSQRIEQSIAGRQAHWRRDYSSRAAYAKSIEPNRHSLRRRVGAVDRRLRPQRLQLVAAVDSPAVVAESDRARVTAVRWSVFTDVDAEGLLLQPIGETRALVVALPDADTTPETLAGLDPQAPAEAAWRCAWRKPVARCLCRR